MGLALLFDQHSADIEYFEQYARNSLVLFLVNYSSVQLSYSDLFLSPKSHAEVDSNLDSTKIIGHIEVGAKTTILHLLI